VFKCSVCWVERVNDERNTIRKEFFFF